MAPLHPGEGHADPTDLDDVRPLGEGVEPPRGAGRKANYAISRKSPVTQIRRPSETLAADAGTVDDLEYLVPTMQGQHFHGYQP
ncbi:hypothetical protein [Streptosporangium sp. NPDC050280]|uniref:hypothetical protein n=1 Tax=unclassified Streptosporangium TaxID=2632669 RepID=UPI0034334F65